MEGAAGRARPTAELMAEARAKGFFAVFYRGVAMRCIHSSYHTAWMAGLGGYISDWWQTRR